MAKKRGLAGWKTMRKEDLVRALVRAARAKAAKAKRVSAARMPSKNGRSHVVAKAVRRVVKNNGAAKPAPRRMAVKVRKKTPDTVRRIGEAHAERERFKDLSTGAKIVTPEAAVAPNGNGGKASSSRRRDRIVLMVRDPYWLHACWEVSRQSVERVRVSLAEAWHTARPMLRLLEVESGSTTSTAERVLREIPIHGGVNNWYIDVQNPPSSFRVAIGYLTSHGKFHAVARSNSVTTPRLGSSDTVDQNWSEVARDYERIYAMSGGYSDEPNGGDLKELFEERLRRPMGAPTNSRYGAAAEGILPRDAQFVFLVDAELLIYGQTRPDAHVTVAGQPVKVRSDGTFMVRQCLPDRRQVLPVVAGSRDGLEQRTVILAVERNTKVLEPVVREVAE
jgi:hypothetical protein